MTGVGMSIWLIIAIIAAVIAVGLLIGMAALRQLSAREDDAGRRQPASDEG